DVADRRGDRVGAHQAGGRRREQRAQVLDVGAGRVQPGVPAVRGEHQRHPGVDLGQGAGAVRRGHGERVGLRLGGDHGAGDPPGPRVVVRHRPVPPELVQAGHREHRTVGRRHEVGLLAGALLLPLDLQLPLLLAGDPLVVAVGGQDAAPGAERAPVGRLLVHGLRAGVDHPGAALGRLRPGGDHAPLQGAQLANRAGIVGVLHRTVQHGVDLLGRRHVVVGFQGLLRFPLLDLEDPREVLGAATRCIPSAHTCNTARLRTPRGSSHRHMESTVSTAAASFTSLWDEVSYTQPDPDPWVVFATLGAALAVVVPHALWRLSRNAITIAHEGGHGLVALLTGRTLTGIRLHSDTSGLTVSRGKPHGIGMILTAAAGYTAPPLLGLGGAALLGAGRITLLLWLATALLLAMLVMIRNAYGALTVLVTGGTFVLVSWLAGPQVQAAFAYAVVWFLL